MFTTSRIIHEEKLFNLSLHHAFRYHKVTFYNHQHRFLVRYAKERRMFELQNERRTVCFNHFMSDYCNFRHAANLCMKCCEISIYHVNEENFEVIPHQKVCNCPHLYASIAGAGGVKQNCEENRGDYVNRNRHIVGNSRFLVPMTPPSPASSSSGGGDLFEYGENNNDRYPEAWDHPYMYGNF